MDYFTKRERIVLLVVVISIISVVIFKMGFKDLKKSEIEPLNFVSTVNTEEIEVEQEEETTVIMVHISGQVYKPGIVEIDLGKRLTDAIKLAGGLKKEADLDRINLAKKLIDEEKIYIPKVGEELNSDIIELVSSNNSNDNAVVSNSTGKININKCSQIELESLPGIGEVLAMRIIDYRNLNVFTTIEDLKQVSGIGDKKYESLKDLITVK
jgi:competence protein ComEA